MRIKVKEGGRGYNMYMLSTCWHVLSSILYCTILYNYIILYCIVYIILYCIVYHIVMYCI